MDDCTAKVLLRSLVSAIALLSGVIYFVSLYYYSSLRLSFLEHLDAFLKVHPDAGESHSRESNARRKCCRVVRLQGGEEWDRRWAEEGPRRMELRSSKASPDSAPPARSARDPTATHAMPAFPTREKKSWHGHGRHRAEKSTRTRACFGIRHCGCRENGPGTKRSGVLRMVERCVTVKCGRKRM